MRPDTAQLLRWHISAPWKLGGEYTLTIPAGAITDVAGFSNDSIIGKYTVFDPEKFATVKIHVVGRDDGTKYIVQLLDGNNSLKQEKRNVGTGDIRFNYVPDAGTIRNCYVVGSMDATVTFARTDRELNMGGLVGQTYQSGATLENGYSAVTIRANTNGRAQIGGLLGHLRSSLLHLVKRFIILSSAINALIIRKPPNVSSN